MKKRSSKTSLDYRKVLLQELQTRQVRNPSYSMSAFSRDLNINPSRMSEILNGKVGLSEERAAFIAEKLKMTANERALFIDLVQSEHARSNLARIAAQKRVRDRLLNSRHISQTDFSVISEWYNLALIQLLDVEGIEHSAESFAKHLGISEDEARKALKQLEQQKYIERKGDHWSPSTPDTTTDVDISSKAIQHYNKQILDKAKEKLQATPVEKRDFSSVVFACNSEQMSYAKERIESFRRSLMKDLEEMAGKDAVYCLSIQFFELTEKK
ncbi:MAG: TIGR02147 family protein [Bdellovibrio sp.]